MQAAHIISAFMLRDAMTCVAMRGAESPGEIARLLKSCQRYTGRQYLSAKQFDRALADLRLVTDEWKRR